ncbi:phosphotransferase [Maribacter sp. MAR_2009_72]|uniref:phosphotransferase n=1 Tax=Maribacter sp. MAR_2009_72 TaxID=1250050 RepID=UPI00119B45EC|nr:phosphotransferase [Maribacter sp. MAR_2009_72]TVZ16945.1 phosphotransferase family enzyme [Maribacter sp. MAR_2009_72]
MQYFYIHPLRPQFFFPKGFIKHKVFISFYKPYSPFGYISWFLFRNIGIYRLFFLKRNIENYIPEIHIRKILNTEAPMAFNMGTKGREQKITALGFDKKQYFFIKYAQTQISRELVSNEYNILNRLAIYDFVPKIISFYQDKNEILLKTSVLKGERVNTVKINQLILNRLYDLAQVNIDNLCNKYKKIKYSFAHGDFCPWNMMDYNGNIQIFDWEMAGVYPLGFDLFTFIYQTNFLLNPEKIFSVILEENELFILEYFHKYGVKDWKLYLIHFCEIKINSEKKKGVNSMLNQYKLLLQYSYS